MGKIIAAAVTQDTFPFVLGWFGVLILVGLAVGGIWKRVRRDSCPCVVYQFEPKE